MIITGMAEYESVCKNALVEWYDAHHETKITLENVFVVWACKTLQNYKALLSTTVSGDGIYAEYTYNGDKQELYENGLRTSSRPHENIPFCRHWHYGAQRRTAPAALLARCCLWRRLA